MGHPNQRELSTLPVELRRTSVPERVRAWVTRATGATVVRIRRLQGASSAAVHGLYLSDGSRVVLRRYVWRHYLEAEPDAPPREVDVLRFASTRGLPAPGVIAADPTGQEIGDGVPVLLMTFLPGRAVAVPDLADLAALAASIHAFDADDLGYEYFRWYDGTMARPPAATEWPALWETAIELWRDAMPPYRPAFIHRDYHPGNVLWARGRVSGVVDWVNGCRGPSGCDVAHCRDNLISLSGWEAADRFLATYESVTGETYHPYWEIASELEHGPSWWTPRQLAQSEPRLAKALQALGHVPSRRRR